MFSLTEKSLRILSIGQRIRQDHLLKSFKLKAFGELECSCRIFSSERDFGHKNWLLMETFSGEKRQECLVCMWKE